MDQSSLSVMALSTRTSTILPLLALLVAGCAADSVEPIGIHPNTVIAYNQLMVPVTVNLNGIDMGTLGAGQTRSYQRGDLDTMCLRYTILPSAAAPFGDTISAYVSSRPAFLHSNDTVAAYINSDTDGDGLSDIFAPAINNTTSVPVVMGVNMETSYENRTGAVSQPGDTGVFLGYYRMPRGPQEYANLRFYRTDKAFHPSQYLVVQFGLGFRDSDIDFNTGRLKIKVDQVPPRAGLGPVTVAD